jgi:uncharacterized membrane protein
LREPSLAATLPSRFYRNIGVVLLGLPAVMIVGFWIPYFSALPNSFSATTTWTVHVHAVLLFTWVMLLVVQPLAIRAHSYTVHRALGKLSLVLVPLIALFAALMVRKEYLENLAAGKSLSAARNGELLSAVQLTVLVALFVFAVRAIRRGQIDAHMRAMICIALVLLPAGLARTLGYWFDIPQRTAQSASLLFIVGSLLTLMLYDRSLHAPSRPYPQTLAWYLLLGIFWVSLGRPVG